MDCKYFEEQVSAAVDNHLTSDELNHFNQHVNRCEGCRNEYEAEGITKSIIRSRVKSIPAPAPIIQRISTQIESETNAPFAGLADLWTNLKGSIFFRPAIGFALAFLAIVAITNLDLKEEIQITPSAYAGSNVLQHSRSNYDAVMRGEIKPQLVSQLPDQLDDFFEGKTQFPVLVPRLKDCKIVGAVLNDHNGMTLAHVVYKHGSEVIYLYETCWKTVLQGEKFFLPAEVQEELMQGRWYASSDENGYSTVLYTDGKTLCSAIAKLPKEELVACLSSVEGTDGTAW